MQIGVWGNNLSNNMNLGNENKNIKRLGPRPVSNGMNVLTVNPGSTSVKYIFFSADGEVIDSTQFSNGESHAEYDWLSSLVGVERISIRIVHGGNLDGPLLIVKDVVDIIEKYAKFAPIHNRLALETINLLERIFTHIPIIASFDTDFHRKIPKHRTIYPLPKNITQKHDIKRYGFHGLALESAYTQVSPMIKGVSNGVQKIIFAHLGGGCSITAVKDGVSVATSMGATPLEGVMMITRSGNIDPGLFEVIAKEEGVPLSKISDILNNHSGFYGLTGSKDTLKIITKAQEGSDTDEKLAFDIFVDQIVQQIYAYYGVLGGCDAVVFSGGIGFGNIFLRQSIVERLDLMGITEDKVFTVDVDEAQFLFENALKVR